MIIPFVLIQVRGYFAILMPCIDSGPMFRANSVKSYLIAKGFDAIKLAAFGLGSQNLIFSNGLLGAEN